MERNIVEVVKALGYLAEVIDTGGNCKAAYIPKTDGKHYLASTEGVAVENFAGYIGEYDHYGDWMGTDWTYRTYEELIEAVKQLPHMVTFEEQARKHLQELGAYDKPNPIVAKAITMRRLLDAGVSDADAYRAVESAIKSEVVIHVRGGNAEVGECPDNIKVRIVDWDDAQSINEEMVRRLTKHGINAYAEYGGYYTIERNDEKFSRLAYSWDGDEMFGYGLVDDEGVHINGTEYYTASMEEMLEYIVKDVQINRAVYN